VYQKFTFFEWLATNENGEPFWVEVNLEQAVIGGKVCFAAVVRHITDRKKVEELKERERATFFRRGSVSLCRQFRSCLPPSAHSPVDVHERNEERGPVLDIIEF
jgi:hypothetical protein